jgi:hypothetical protein
MATRGILRSRSGWAKPNRRVYNAETRRNRQYQRIIPQPRQSFMQASSCGLPWHEN